MDFPNVTGSRWKVILFIFIFLVACAPVLTAESTSQSMPSPAVVEDCARGDYTDEIESGGQARRFLLHIPATYQPERPAALVLMFHGAGIGAERFVEYTRFSSVADREGFLVVYPQALGNYPTWNTTSRPNNPDIQFARDLIEHLERRCNVDPNRLYASGHSNGGGMANRLACDLADRIAAIGSVSGAYQWSEECSPSRPVAIFAIHGTDDPIIPYNGHPQSTEPPAAYNTISVPIPQWASSWAARNECGPAPTEIIHNVLISEQIWSNCGEGADVILYTIQDHGHEWPDDLIDVGQTIWDFFAEYPR